MVDRLLLREHNISQDEIEKELADVLADPDVADLDKEVEKSLAKFEAGAILKGQCVNVLGDDVIVDVGYKSEGVVPLQEFGRDEVKPGDEFEVLLDAVEDEGGSIVLSKRKADRIRGWERVIEEHAEDDVVTGRVMRKIKGGLLVDIGVPVFLPASQIDIRRPGDIGEYIGNDITCKILKIDEDRHNIVVSRRKLIEEQRDELKRGLMSEIAVGQIRKGTVKNIADFGAFVDLGGIDGLLHITDMSWGRVSHPSEMVAIDQEIEVVVLNVDPDKEKIALGLKQKTSNPWMQVPEKYPVGESVQGEVVNIVNYGCFVKIEEGVEGLVHISEMSWTRRVNHPSEIVAIGDIVDVVVLDINEEKQEISLGMKQTEVNPWTLVEEKYPQGTVIQGRVRNLTNYGAFIEIEEGIDGLLHMSDMSWTRKVSHPSEVVKKGDIIEAMVISVSQEKKRVALGLKQLHPDPWEADIPSRLRPGDVVTGTVTKLTSFGAFVELEENLEGLLHISEMADHKVNAPEDVVQVGQPIQVTIIRVDTEGRKIGLSMRANPPIQASDASADASAGAMQGAVVAESRTPDTPLPGQGAIVAESRTPDAPEEKPQAEPAPAEEQKAEEAQAAEPQAEVAQAEEPQAEEPQPEEPQPEEPQPEEFQAEEPQAEEPQAEASEPESQGDAPAAAEEEEQGQS